MGINGEPPKPPYDALLGIANVLPPGRTGAEPEHIALYGTWEVDPRHAKAALARLRATRAKLAATERDQVDKWLADWHVDLLDGDVSAAMARVVRERGAAADPLQEILSGGDVTALAATLVRMERLEEAVALLGNLPVGDCGTDVAINPREDLGRHLDDDPRRMAALMDRLENSAELRRACPNGLPPDLLAVFELNARRYDRAVAATERVADVGIAGEPRLRIVRALRNARRLVDARRLALIAAERLPSDAGAGDRRAVRLRGDAISELARLGERAAAKRMAAGLSGPGARAIARSAIAGLIARPIRSASRDGLSASDDELTGDY